MLDNQDEKLLAFVIVLVSGHYQSLAAVICDDEDDPCDAKKRLQL